MAGRKTEVSTVSWRTQPVLIISHPVPMFKSREFEEYGEYRELRDLDQPNSQQRTGCDELQAGTELSDREAGAAMDRLCRTPRRRLRQQSSCVGQGCWTGCIEHLEGRGGGGSVSDKPSGWKLKRQQRVKKWNARGGRRWRIQIIRVSINFSFFKWPVFWSVLLGSLEIRSDRAIFTDKPGSYGRTINCQNRTGLTTDSRFDRPAQSGFKNYDVEWPTDGIF